MKYFYLLIFGLFLNLTPLQAQQQPDVLPIYPGCEQADVKMLCFKENLMNFISDNFNTELLKKIKKNEKGKIKMFVTFIVNENGKIDKINVKSDYDFLNEEMKRVLSEIPVMQPAKKDGQPIKIKYTLPVLFEIPD